MSIIVSNLDVSIYVGMDIMMYNIVRIKNTFENFSILEKLTLSRWDVLLVTQEPLKIKTLCLKIMTQKWQFLQVFTV